MKILKTLTLSLAAVTIGSAALAVTLTQEGEIRKLDKSTQMATIEHGPPKERPDQPKKLFTYNYKIPDAATFNSLKVGDRILFVTDDMGTNKMEWTVTKIEKR
jgi:Cu/Ag efflux protein CusF